MEPKTFRYKVHVEKSIRLKAFDVPGIYRGNIKEAELDIEAALKKWELDKNLDVGIHEFSFSVLYMPCGDNTYIPHYHDYDHRKLEKQEEVLVKDYRVVKVPTWKYFYNFLRKKIKRK